MKNSYFLFPSKKERSQAEVRQGMSKASQQRRLRKRFAKSQVPDWNLVVTVLLCTIWPHNVTDDGVKSFPSVRTNEKQLLNSFQPSLTDVSTHAIGCKNTLSKPT